MGKKYEGQIVAVYKNYGTLKSTIDNHDVSIHFLILPDMLSNGEFQRSETVRFQMKNIEIRKSKVYVAYALENIKGLEVKNWNFSSHQYERTIARDYYSYLFKKMADDASKLSKENLNQLIEFDKQAKEFFLKWILYFESLTKEVLVETLNTIDVSTTTIYRVLNEDGKTKMIVSDQFKTAKSKYMFQPEFSLLKLEKSKTDPNDVIVVDCPFSLFLKSLTLTEFGEVLNQLLLRIDLFKDETRNNYNYLHLVKESFLELAFTRNASAHGNPLIPMILDVNFNANYFYEMASVFPSWNSKDNVEKWTLFHYIRFSARSLYKQGIPLVAASGPMLSALAFTKSLLINPARRSFFMFFFVMKVALEYIDESSKENFWNESTFLVMNPNDDNSIKNYLDVFPNQADSIKKQLTHFILPVYAHGEGDFYKAMVEAQVDIQRRKYLVMNSTK